MHETLGKAAQKAEQFHQTSKGEKLFDWLVYGGIAGLGVLVATVPIAYWSKYSGGKKAFEWAERRLAKSGIDPRSAHEMVMTTALMQGGNLALIPIKMAENNKAQIVSGMNKALGEPDTYCEVKSEPDQTWGSLIKSRLVAWGAVFASLKAASSMLGHERFDAFENSFAKNVACKPFGFPTHLPNGQETRAFRMGKLTALDIFATAAAAGILYGASRVFAVPDKDNPHSHHEAEKGDAPVLAAPESTEPIIAHSHAQQVQETLPASTRTTTPSSRSVLAIASQKHHSSFAETALSRQNQPPSLQLD